MSRFGVIRFPGSCDETDAVLACERVGEAELLWHRDAELVDVDAIVVQQQTNDNEFADYDPEDARYNFFRWIVSGRAFAMGPSRVDPRTGQILDADIIMDDSFVRVYMQDFDLLAPSAIEQLKGPGFKLWRQRYPDLAEAMRIKLTREQLRDISPTKPNWMGSDA